MITCLNWWSKNGHKHNINVLIYLTAPSKELLSLCIVACRGKMRFEFWGTPLFIYFWISFTAKFLNIWAAIGAFSFLYDDIWALDVFMMGIEDSLLKEPTICSLRLTRTVIFCRKRCSASSYCNRCMPWMQLGNGENQSKPDLYRQQCLQRNQAVTYNFKVSSSR